MIIFALSSGDMLFPLPLRKFHPEMAHCLSSKLVGELVGFQRWYYIQK